MPTALEAYKTRVNMGLQVAKNQTTVRSGVRIITTAVSGYALGRAEAKYEGATNVAIGAALATRLFIDDPLVQAAAEGVLDAGIGIKAYQKGMLDGNE